MRLRSSGSTKLSGDTGLWATPWFLVRPGYHSPTHAQVPTIKGTGVPSIDLMIKRVYEPQLDADGFRVLIDRLWPRGLSKVKVAVDLWLRDVAPSAALRTWFNHDPARWTEFRRRYATELDRVPAVVDQLIDRARQGRATLLYSEKHLWFESKILPALKTRVAAALG
jgi:uncharacterized protein YeaO (DUF488 family)